MPSDNKAIQMLSVVLRIVLELGDQEPIDLPAQGGHGHSSVLILKLICTTCNLVLADNPDTIVFLFCHSVCSWCVEEWTDEGCEASLNLSYVEVETVPKDYSLRIIDKIT